MRIACNDLRYQGVQVEMLRENWGKFLQLDARKMDEGRKKKLLSNSEYILD